MFEEDQVSEHVEDLEPRDGEAITGGMQPSPAWPHPVLHPVKTPGLNHAPHVPGMSPKPR